MFVCCVNISVMVVFFALTAYSFFDNRPEALPVHVKNTAQLELF